MRDTVRNLLYDHPEYYESLYPEPHDETPSMCRRIFARFLKTPPRSLLDVGCGTGRDLRSLRKDCPDCVGVDYLSQMIQYAKSRSNNIQFVVGDMRSFRLGRTFDAVSCFGSAILYALTNDELDQALGTFAAHCHKGSLLILDMRNAAGFLVDGFKSRIEGDVDSAGLTAHYVAEHTIDGRRQLLIRKRTWQFADGRAEKDYCEYRMLFPQEIAYLLSSHGFAILGMYDNMHLKDTDFSGSTMYVVAVYNAPSNLLLQPTPASGRG